MTLRSSGRAFLALAALVAGGGISCTHPSGANASRSRAAFASPPTQYLDGGPVRVDLLARQLLVGAEQPPGRYAFYCYLLYADRSHKWAGARHAAASAYLSLLTNVAEIGGSVKPEHMAVLFAPIKTDESAAQVLASKDVELFLAAYDHDRARVLVSALERSGYALPRVAVVGHRAPLEGAREIRADEVLVVNLELTDEAAVEQRILRLQSDLVSGEPRDIAGEPGVLKALRAFFAMFGTTLDALGKIAEKAKM